MADIEQDSSYEAAEVLTVKVGPGEELHFPPQLCRLVAEACESQANEYFDQMKSMRFDKPLPKGRAQEIVEYFARQGHQLRLIEKTFRQHSERGKRAPINRYYELDMEALLVKRAELSERPMEARVLLLMVEEAIAAKRSKGAHLETKPHG